MTDLVNKLIRTELKELVPYESARRLFSMASANEVETAWLNANENPYVPNVSIDPSMYNRYPDFQPEPLIKGYADYAGVLPEQVLATRGADEGIELLIRTFCSSNDNIIICPPTYGMYAISAKTHGTGVITIPLLEVQEFEKNVAEKAASNTSNLQLDVETILANKQKANLIFICCPNNPTGDLVNTADIINIIESTADDCIVVLDEAYIEFCADATSVSLINKYDNVVVLRTLSKAFGLAGLRCGFTLTNNNIMDALKKVIAPYPISAPVAQIATQTLSADGINWMKGKVAELNALRDSFITNAKTWSFVEKVYPSQTNFVLLKLNSKLTAATAMQTFQQQNVLLRDQSKQLMLENTIRVSIGNQQQMELVNSIFSKVEQSL